MRHRWLINAVLALVVIILAWAAISRPGKDDTPKTQPFTSINGNNISSIKLTRTHLPAVEFKKTSGIWRMTSPLSARANPYNISALINIATSDTETKFESSDADLTRYGFKKSKNRLWLDSHELVIGDQHPLKNSRYVKFNNSVAVLPVYTTRIIETSATDFVETRLLEEGAKLNRIELEKTTLTLTNGQWHITGKPKTEKALPGADDLNMFVENWQQARALTVQKYSGREALHEITLGLARTDGKTSKLHLSILAYEPELVLYRKDEGLEYRFTQDAGKQLLTLPEPAPAPAPADNG